MKKHQIIVFFFLLIGSKVQAEIWPTLSIVELAIRSDRIVEAKYLGTSGSKSKFLIRELQDQASFFDTLMLQDLDEYFNDFSDFEKAEEIILYLTEGSENTISWSGLRVLINNRIHLPVQYINPGKFELRQSRDTLNWVDLKENILQSQKRINYIKELKKRKNSQKLLKWINEQKHQLNVRGGLNENIGWGSYGLDVFKWIMENNESSSTWKASLLFKEIHYPKEKEWLGYTGLLSDENGTSFKTYREIDFLIKTSLDESIKMIDRRQALVYLKTACRKVYENNCPIPETNKLNKQKEKQRSICNLILPLLDNPNLKTFAFEIVSSLSNPKDGTLGHRIDLQALPIIIEHYKNEMPSEYKSDLAYFIVYNSTNEQWKQISGCDAKIFIDIYSIRVHEIKNHLSFYLRKRFGSEHFAEKPIVEFRDSKTKQILHSEILSNSKLSKYYGDGQNVIIENLNLIEGIYELQVKGKAGENSHLSWQTISIPFTIEKKKPDNKR
jgi:hypothetical protein